MLSAGYSEMKSMLLQPMKVSPQIVTEISNENILEMPVHPPALL